MKNKKKWGFIVLALGVLVFLGINAKSISQKFGVIPGGNGTISLTVPVTGSTVFMDGKKLQVTSKNDETLTIKDLSEKSSHTAIVSKQGYWPWSKSLKVINGMSVSIKAFNGITGQNVVELPSSSTEYSQALSSLKKAAAPTKDKMIISKSTNVGIWLDGKDIYARWIPKSTPDDFFCLDEHLCRREEMVFRSTAPITTISFYKNRDDVILFSSGGSIFAIEIDQKGTQNFQPVYEGADTTFASKGDDSLFIRDSGKILKLSL